MGQVLGRNIMLVDMLTKGRVQTRAREEMDLAWNRIDPDKWYDNSSTLNAYLRSIDKKLFGSKRGLYEVGKEIIPTLKNSTPVMNHVHDAITGLQGLDPAYKTNNQGDDIGGFFVEDITDSSMTIRDNTQQHYSEFVRGVIEGHFDAWNTHRLIECKVEARREKGALFNIFKLKFERI